MIINTATRRVRFFRDPSPHPSPWNEKLDIGLLDVAHAAVSEALQSGGPASAFLGQLEAFLAAGPGLVWKGNGPGLGRELRRAFSNIHGRYFARYYLEVWEGVFGLLPIEGNSYLFNHNAVVRLRANERGDMPDWVGWSSGGFVVAEAKGTYGGGDWANALRGANALPQPLQKAQQQVERVQIDVFGIAQDVAFKAWSVASRWATEANGLDPWLAAIDPQIGEFEIPRDSFEEIVATMQRLTVRRMLVSVGLHPGAPTGASDDPEELFRATPAVPEDYMTALTLVDGQKLFGVTAAVGPTAIIPLSGSQDLEFVLALPDGLRPLLLVTIQEKPIVAASEARFLPEYEVRRGPTTIARNGIALTSAHSVRGIERL